MLRPDWRSQGWQQGDQGGGVRGGEVGFEVEEVDGTPSLEIEMQDLLADR